MQAVHESSLSSALHPSITPEAFGTIEQGQRADLVLLGRNPLASVSNVKDPEGVIVNGTWLSRLAITARLDAIAKSYGR